MKSWKREREREKGSLKSLDAFRSLKGNLLITHLCRLFIIVHLDTSAHYTAVRPGTDLTAGAASIPTKTSFNQTNCILKSQRFFASRKMHHELISRMISSSEFLTRHTGPGFGAQLGG